MISALEVWALSGQGGAQSMYQTLIGYSKRGHEVHLVAPRVGANHHFGAPPQTPPALPGVTHHLFDVPSLAQLPLPWPRIVRKADQKLRFALVFPLQAARRAEQLLAEQEFHLLYGYEVHGVLAQRLVRRRHALPLIARFQGSVMYPYLGRRLQLWRRYEEVLALKTAADLYIMTDDGTRGDEVLLRLNPAAKRRLRFWRNGLDLGNVRPPTQAEARSARAALGLAEDDFVLVTATRLARWKRVDRAIDAVAILRDRGVGAVLLVVGDGEERQNLEQQAQELGLQDRVRFVGSVPQQQVQQYLWCADVFLSVNELSNVGNPLLEAMMTGRCILTLDEGDTRDLIQDDRTGVLLPSGEPALIAAALAQLAADPSRRARLAAEALKVASGFWSWQERMDAEIEAVEEVITSRAAGADV